MFLAASNFLSLATRDDIISGEDGTHQAFGIMAGQPVVFQIEMCDGDGGYELC